MILAPSPNHPVNRTTEHPPLGCLYPPRAASGYFYLIFPNNQVTTLIVKPRDKTKSKN
jgi:hypothetical protein